MRRRVMLLFAAAALAGLPNPGFAAASFTCAAKGDAWTVSGGPSRSATCTVACVLTDPQGDHDRVVCAAKLSGGTTDTVCDGVQAGRHWTGAELVTAQCSYDQP